MGCSETKDKNMPVLIFNFEPKNEKQKEYCMKLKDKCSPPCKLGFVICSRADVPFGITLNTKTKVHIIQEHYNDSEEEMNKALNDIYEILREEK